MAGDIFDNLMKGLSDLMPEDDPFIKPLQLQGEIKKLKAKEDEIYKEVGKKALELDGEIRYREDLGRLLQIRRKRQAVQEKLYKIQAEKNARKGPEGWGGTQRPQEAAQPAETAEKQEMQQEPAAPDPAPVVICQECGCENPSENHFCRECGTKLGVVATKKCPGCGNDMDLSSKFCGKCGQKL